MDTATQLEQWLRQEAAERSQRASSRRSGAMACRNCTDEDRKIAHQLAERSLGRKIPKTTRELDEASAAIQERIASKLDDEAAMLTRFADLVAEVLVCTT